VEPTEDTVRQEQLRPQEVLEPVEPGEIPELTSIDDGLLKYAIVEDEGEGRARGKLLGEDGEDELSIQVCRRSTQVQYSMEKHSTTSLRLSAARGMRCQTGVMR
jgi:hypothetical protein